MIMIQTDDIHESFYDLFNQRFRHIDDPTTGTRLYANIAIGAHLKPCRVHQDFQCIIMLKTSEVKQAPLPFLNRFEKYSISYESVSDAVMQHMPPEYRTILQAAIKKVCVRQIILSCHNNACMIVDHMYWGQGSVSRSYKE